MPNTSKCSIHEVDEDATDAYKVCMECGHVYKTEDELLMRHNEMLHSMAKEQVEQLDNHLRGFCGWCLHDFW